MTSEYKKIYWTEHVKVKMRQYGLSKTKLLQLLHRPERKEEGIAPGTVAVMQTKKVYSKPQKVFEVKKTLKIPGEIWLMYKDTDPSTGSGQAMRRIISAWRYPGVSKPGERIPIPQEIRKELLNHFEF